MEAPKPTVPLSELLDTRHRAQRAEERVETLARQLEQFQRSFEAQRPQQPPIDPVTDPEGAFRFLAQQQTEQALHQRANMSEMLARRDPVYGAKVDEAVEEAKKAGLNRHFMSQADPYKALMDWHTSKSVAQQVGPDLNAYRQKVREELIAEMKAAAGKPTTPQTLPPSLATATNAGLASPVVQDSNDFFKSMMAEKRAVRT